MKKTILALSLLVSMSAFAISLAEDIHNSSAGMLIKIAYNGQLVGVSDAKGEYKWAKDAKTPVQVANVLCDLNLSWTATDDAIYCIAK